MNKLFLSFLAFTLLSISGYSQKISVIYQDPDFFSKREGNFFFMVHPDLKLDNHLLVATLKGTVTNTHKLNLNTLFDNFKRKANYLGANMFRIDTVARTEHDSITVTINIYQFFKEEAEYSNNKFKDPNIYIMGELIDEPDYITNLKINKEETFISPLTYLAIELADGEKLKLNKGGFTGTQVTFKGAPDRTPTFVTLGNFTASPSVSPGGGVGVSFSSGTISPVNMHFGYFIIAALGEKARINFEPAKLED